MKKFIICFSILMCIVSLLPAANPPERISYQGVLRDSSDNPVNGNVSMKFRFYDDPVAGTLLWEEAYNTAYPPMVNVSNGLFTISFGDPAHRVAGSIVTFSDIFKNYTNVYLGIVVAADPEMIPRIKMLASAYSLNALHIGGRSAAEFLDTSSTAQIKNAQLTLNASGATSGYGVEGRGPDAGGFFMDSDGTAYTYAGYGGNGVYALGYFTGGYFQDSDNSGRSFVGYYDYGIYSSGNYMGGYFQDWDSSGHAYVGYGDVGIEAYGNVEGGYFKDSDSSGESYVGYSDIGVLGYGNYSGGFFQDVDSNSYAYAGYAYTGIEAYGSMAGGYFQDNDSSGYAYAGYGDYGISAGGNYEGGYFQSTGPYGYGIEAYGNQTGGYFQDNDSSGYAYVGYGDYGIYARGDTAGGYFNDYDDYGSYAYVGSYSDGTNYKIRGGGTVSFVQNHPEAPDRVIVYAAPEGDEVAVYTRGTAQLADGKVRIALSESFRFVANPDIGLTAHLTPHGPTPGLYIESLTPKELVVLEMEGGTGAVAFDYIVYGLRLGFEQMPNIQQKTDYSPTPPPGGADEYYNQNPTLPRANALARFQAMRADAGLTPADLSRSQQLIAAINTFNPEIDGKLESFIQAQKKPQEIRPPVQTPAASGETLPPIAPPLPKVTNRATADTKIPAPSAVTSGTQLETSAETEAPAVNLFPVSEPVEIGDLLTLDLFNPGQFQKARTAADRNVVGIVAAEPVTQDGQLKAALIETNFGVIKVDASYGAILPGDLLVTSATPGHAMRAPEVHAEGTVIGKALESLQAGTGLIKVLVMLR